MFTKDLLEGARNFIKWCNVQAGDKVMIAICRIPPLPDREVIEALIATAEEKGADAFEMYVKPYATLRGEPAPDYVDAAAKVCDLFISLFSPSERRLERGGLFGVGHGQISGIKKFLDRYGINWQNCRLVTVEDMSSEHARYPLELLFEIAKRVINKFLSGGTCRVTTPSGTDVTMGINPDYWGGNAIWHTRPGTFVGVGFPGIVYGIVPWQPYNGRIVVDAFMPHWNPPEVYIKPGDCVITVENGRATKLTGIHGEWVANFLDIDKNGRWGAEMMFGFHPHACPKSWQNPVHWFSDLHDRATTLHLAFGNSIGRAGPYYSAMHFDVYTYYPTVYLNREKLIDNGHLLLLEDPGLREFAKQFGDPDYLLTEKPIPKVVEQLIKR